jgi:hypothetical protein
MIDRFKCVTAHVIQYLFYDKVLWGGREMRIILGRSGQITRIGYTLYPCPLRGECRVLVATSIAG